MNTRLVEYGLTTEESDYRAHVDLRSGVVILFPTEAAREQLLSGEYEVYPVTNRLSRIVTAEGARVPHEDIAGAWLVKIPRQLQLDEIPNGPVEKGRLAESIFGAMLNSGLITFPVAQIRDRANQLRGVDYEAPRTGIQVKCDLGALHRGVFLQIRECNPYRQY